MSTDGGGQRAGGNPYMRNTRRSGLGSPSYDRRLLDRRTVGARDNLIGGWSTAASFERRIESPSILLSIYADRIWSRDKDRDHRQDPPRREQVQTSFEINSCPVIYGSWPRPSYGWDAIHGYLALEQLPRMVNSKTRQCCAWES